ncbi:MAG: tyrosine-type recombinase/integrase [Oscillospiraceae bacterium]|jgi:integrase|nr:tyrosine-type recombinase/integrase [Oscillospiraceae bacterium]
MAATEPIRNKNQVRELAQYYLNRGEFRNYALIVMSVHTALRISDLLRLNWNDVYDFELGRVYKRFSVVEQKTKKPKIVAMNKDAIAALELFATSSKLNPTSALFESRKTGRAISRIQAYRIIHTAADALELGRVSCHSLRKTFGYHAWKNGASPAVIMAIYAHSSFSITQRYLGIEQDDKDEVYASLSYQCAPTAMPTLY